MARGRMGGGGVAAAAPGAMRGRRPGRGRGRGHGGDSVGKFLAPHTGRQAGKIANAEAGTEYNPAIREDRQQMAGSRKREGDLASWYAQLSADYQGAQNAGAAALQSIESTTSQQLAEADQRSSADQARLAAQDEAFAKLTGGPKDTAGLAQIAQAGAAASRARVDSNLPVAQEQANFVGRLGSEKAASRLRGIEARGEEHERRDKIRSDLAATRKEKGAARVSHKEDLRQADRGYATDRAQLRLQKREAAAAEQSAAAEAALARIKAAQEARQDAIGNRQEQERIGISRRNAKTAAKSQRATARNYREDNKNNGKLTPAERRSRGEHSADAMSTARALLGIKVPKSPKQWAQFEAALIEKLGSSYGAEAAAAVAELRKRQARAGYKRRRERTRRNYPHR